MLVRAFLRQLAWRSAVEAIFLSARRAERGGPWPIAFLGTVFLVGPVAIRDLLSFGRWLLTGHGPGMRRLLHDIGPAQRVRSRSRSGSRPGRA